MYIDKDDTRFLIFVMRKYQVRFDSIEECLRWFYEDVSHSKKRKYYQNLEEEIWLYSNLQTGKEE